VPQSDFPLQVEAWQLPPPQVPLEPQSALELQLFVVHMGDEQESFELVPQSAFEPQATDVHLAPAQVTPLAH
jgi:hypothetical protein